MNFKMHLVAFGTSAIPALSLGVVYHVEVVPQYLNDVSFDAQTINDHGVIAGYSRSGTGITSIKRVLTYNQRAGFQVIVDNLPNDENLGRPRINNAGQIAYAARPGSSQALRTFLYTPGAGSSMLEAPINLMNYTPDSLNDRGDVIGLREWQGQPMGGAIWRHGEGFEDRPDGIYMSSIEENGAIVGQFNNRGILWRPGKAFRYMDFPSPFTIFVGNMNASGEVITGYWAQVGNQFRFTSWLWSANLQTHLETPLIGGHVLNDGSVVGRLYDGTTFPSAANFGRWTRTGGYFDITQNLDAESAELGFTNWQIRSVNNRGEVLARAGYDSPYSSAIQPYTVIIRPVPEPATLLVLAAGIPALLRRRKR